MADLINFVRAAATFFPKLVVDHVADPNGVVDSAAGLFSKSSDKERRELIEAVLRWLPTPLPLEALLDSAKAVVTSISQSISQSGVSARLGGLADASLRLASQALDRANPVTLLETAANIAGTVSSAFLQNVGQLPIIRQGVLSNSINTPTLELVWGQRAELVTFLVDIVECAKCFYPANGTVSGSHDQQLRVRYNELDVSKHMNRHAIICQLQRLAKSLAAILRTPVRPDFQMRERDTKLDTDRIQTTENDLIRVTSGNPRQWPSDKHWLFVNGICGEYHWLKLSCEKLEVRFGRKTVGVLNRGDGILWDLVECAGERSVREEGSTASQDSLIRRTASSRDAQRLLTENLELMIGQAGPDAESVVVAHSQGCLLLRLALEELIRNSDDATRQRMKDHLCVFTFGNPSVHWKADNGLGPSLDSHSRRTEHFANKSDFVAKLGVLRPRHEDEDDGYTNVYENNTWKGHLFGAQYSLEVGDYTITRGDKSWLLCRSGSNQPIAPPD